MRRYELNLLKKYPIPMAGLILSIFALGNLLQSYGDSIRNVIGIIGFILYAIYVLKLIVLQKGVKEQLENPLIGSVFLTITMATMLFATYIKPISPTIGLVVWWIGVVGHLVLMILFSKKFLTDFSIKKVFPSWFIVYVGIVVASVTAPMFEQIAVGKIAFWFGFITYLILIPIILKRVWVVKEMPEPTLPTIIILAAPGSLLLAGYINSFDNKSMAIVYLLFAFSIVFYLIALAYLPRLLKLKFYPSFSSFTFPMVISAIATKQLNGFLIKAGNEITWLVYIVKAQEIIAICLVLYVFVLYMMSLMKTEKAVESKA
jgi:exfoliative toxin A/B